MGGSNEVIWSFLLGGTALGLFVLACTILIGLLLFTLVYGAVLVILAVTQIVTNRNKPAPAPPKAVLVRPAPGSTAACPGHLYRRRAA